MFSKLGKKISSIFTGKKVSFETLEELEELLITSDISYDIVSDMIEKIKKEKFDKETTPEEIKNFLKSEFLKILKPVETNLEITLKPFSIVLMGVNGSGKTTTIGKLAHKFKSDGKSVSLIACDTFRLSATEQLKDWADKTGANFISKANANPSGLAYDGYLKSKENDIIMFDTAGRLSNNQSLMAELEKIIKTIGKVDNNAPTKTILVLDGTGGQNSIMQMENFSSNIKIDGLIITKTEGTSKSGFVISLAKKYETPIYFITNGEDIKDITPFNSENFIDNLLEI